MTMLEEAYSQNYHFVLTVNYKKYNIIPLNGI